MRFMEVEMIKNHVANLSLIKKYLRYFLFFYQNKWIYNTFDNQEEQKKYLKYLPFSFSFFQMMKGKFLKEINDKENKLKKN